MSDENKSKPSVRLSAGVDVSQLQGKELILAVKKMNVGEKTLLAIKGSAAVRRLLIRDSNVDVQLAVVNSPKTSEAEIEQLASLAATAEVILKTVFSDSRWSKSYRIKLALVKNPKTPNSIVTRCVAALTPHDLRKLIDDPNTRNTTAQAAQRMLNRRK